MRAPRSADDGRPPTDDRRRWIAFARDEGKSRARKEEKATLFRGFRAHFFVDWVDVYDGRVIHTICDITLVYLCIIKYGTGTCAHDRGRDLDLHSRHRSRSIKLDRSIDVEGGIFPGKPARAVDGTPSEDAVQRSRSSSARRRARMLSRGNASTAMRRMVLDNARHALRSMARR